MKELFESPVFFAVVIIVAGIVLIGLGVDGPSNSQLSLEEGDSLDIMRIANASRGKEEAAVKEYYTQLSERNKQRVAMYEAKLASSSDGQAFRPEAFIALKYLGIGLCIGALLIILRQFIAFVERNPP